MGDGNETVFPTFNHPVKLVVILRHPTTEMANLFRLEGCSVIISNEEASETLRTM